MVQWRMGKVISVVFYKSASNNEPVREWLKSLSKDDMRLIGEDIKTVEFGWPIGMPLAKSMGDSLWEVRTNLTDGKIARVLFVIEDGFMILLHGFVKKDRKTPKKDLDLAKARAKEMKGR